MIGNASLDRARTLLEVRRPQQALDELARLPTDVVETPEVYRLRTEALIMLQRWGDAAAAARAGLSFGADAQLLGQLGLALHALKDYPAAERAYLDGLEIHQGAGLMCRYALLCLSVGQLSKASGLLRLATTLEPQAAIVYVTRIQLAYAQGRDREAQRVAAEFVGQYPGDPLALALYGRSSVLRGQTVTAYSAFQQAVAQDPSDQKQAEAAWELKVANHPLLRPLRPLHRLGPVLTWLIVLVAFLALRAAGLVALPVLLAFLTFIYYAYSWVAPTVVRRLLGPGPGHAVAPERGVGAPVRRGAPGTAVIVRWLVGGVVLVAALSCLGLTAVDIGPAARAAMGKGTPGTIVLTNQQCDSRCHWFGDFTSDDGTVVRHNASMQEGVPGNAKVGDRLPALNTGARDGVYPRTGSMEWVYIAIFMGLGVVALLGWLFVFVVVPLIQRRRRAFPTMR